jgi:hypothetical protein
MIIMTNMSNNSLEKIDITKLAENIKEVCF